MYTFFFGAVVALTLWSAGPALAAAPGTPEAPGTIAKSATAKVTPVPTVAELYSLRARRRMATYLRLRLLEWREAGLERAAAVVERRLPVDVLVPKR